MKSRFEKEFRAAAYKDAPDGWSEFSKRAACVPLKTIKDEKPRIMTDRLITAAVAAFVLVIAAAVIGTNMYKNRIARENIGQTADTLPAASGLPEEEQTRAETRGEADSVILPDGSAETAASKPGAVPESAGGVTAAHPATAEESTARPQSDSFTGTRPATAAQTAAAAADRSTTANAVAETVIEKGWDSKTLPEKYPAVKYKGREYVNVENTGLATKRRTAKLASDVTVENWDFNGKNHKTTVDLYSIEGFGTDLAIGLSFKGSSTVYVYRNEVAYTPATLGDFLKDTDFDNAVTFGGVDLYRGGRFPVNAANRADMKKYLFADSGIKNEPDKEPQGTSVVFSVSSEELGIHNRAFRLYESGYISTNITGRRITFFIGRDRAEAFLKNSYNISFETLNDMKNTGGNTVTGTTSRERYSEAYTIPE